MQAGWQSGSQENRSKYCSVQRSSALKFYIDIQRGKVKECKVDDEKYGGEGPNCIRARVFSQSFQDGRQAEKHGSEKN